MAAITPKDQPPLVAAAAALDAELRAYDDLAREARRMSLSSEKGLQRAVRVVQESAGRNEAIQEKVRALVEQIEQARARQVESLQALLDAARAVQARAEQHDGLMRRFAALGESAQSVNSMAAELSAKRKAGAAEAELLRGLDEVETRMANVVSEAESLAALAADQDWPDLAKQADAVRQQVLAAKNKLAMARQKLATSAPS